MDISSKSQLLYDDKWCQLKRVIYPEQNIFGYTYLHEIRCNGKIISILPYRIVNENFEFLFRVEKTPCWNLTAQIISTITGGVDKGHNPLFTARKELEEETGYVVTENDIIFLGCTYGTKSCDTRYYLYSVDLTDKIQEKEYSVETELDKLSYCKWGNTDNLIRCEDPFSAACYVRLMNILFK